MNSPEDAEHYQADKDNEADWEEVPAPRRRRSERRRLSSIVSVRFTPQEADEMRRRAGRMGLTMSSYLRHMALRDIPPLGRTAGDSVTTTVAGPVIVYYPATKEAS